MLKGASSDITKKKDVLKGMNEAGKREMRKCTSKYIKPLPQRGIKMGGRQNTTNTTTTTTTAATTTTTTTATTTTTTHVLYYANRV